MNYKKEIEELENKILSALQNRDIKTMEELLHENLLFNLPSGQTVTKKIDLENLKTGIISIKEIKAFDQIITTVDDVATVAVTYNLKADLAGNTIDGAFRYLRVWKLFKDGWKVIAGSGTTIK